jgi:hypothetical protein
MLRPFVLTCVLAVALPAAAGAQPNRYRVEVSLTPGARAVLTVGTVPQGEFSFRLRASSDDEKRITLTQRRNGGTAFTVLDTASSQAADVCEGAAGTLVCSNVTTPVTPAGRTWTLVLRNRGSRPAQVALTVTWRRVGSAG